VTRRERLARIIELKARLRDARRGELALAETREGQAEEAVDEAAARLATVAARYARPAELTGAELALRAEAVRAARDGHRRARSTLDEAAAERAVRADAVAEAGREVRSLELLAERREAERRLRERRAEQAALDECARLGVAG